VGDRRKRVGVGAEEGKRGRKPAGCHDTFI